MIEEADRFTLTTGPDGRVLLSLALRRHPRASADGFALAKRYWACVPGGAQPRWLMDVDESRLAVDAHSAAAAYLPGVCCSGCRDRQWKPVDRRAVTRYVLTGVTGGCLSCQEPVTAVAPVVREVLPARRLPAVTVRVDGAAAALLWSATGGDPEMMSSLVTDLVSSNFGFRRPGS